MSAARRYRLNHEGRRRLVVVYNGCDGYEASVTTHCSGCCDLGEYAGMASNYPYDDKAGCRVGSGCHECGYTGKRRETLWVPFEPLRYAALMEAR